MPSFRQEAGLSSLQGEGGSGKAPQKVKVDVNEAVERIRTQVQTLQRDLNFSVDDSTGQVVVQVLDGDSGKVVRQIPSEDILRLAERLDEMRSLLFEAKA
ncbi:flagellin [Stutzerimonas frequens]|uniref:Flagellar protein FlaG n=1 Tax=Stutzerimonas frequens TaxID=2968969 RepID=A0ABX6Y0I3_9GAMM|nr:flagellar protein FlaG [Stutzerimonas frequens]MCQ4305612.1 flagellar protein FlaG [Stutzerimonas frequens]PNF49226.1 flagellin [Stutzerimonas frequens]QPT19847.1 flagellar protein FlaG [Stutzerimonas frequens]